MSVLLFQCTGLKEASSSCSWSQKLEVNSLWISKLGAIWWRGWGGNEEKSVFIWGRHKAGRWDRRRRAGSQRDKETDTSTKQDTSPPLSLQPTQCKKLI
jgi:hypothetical protein